MMDLKTASRAMRILAAVFLLAAAWSCSLKKNTAMTRNYQAFITRYNIYYNGDDHYVSTMKELEESYPDDYTRLLYVHPTDAHRDPDATKPTGSFTRSIEKAQKAIQLRSIKKRPARKAGRTDAAYKEWMRREEYNPFLHNAWMMMGRAQYANGDFLGAASTFYYVAKHFSWLPNTVTEARLWQARSYANMGWDFEAENILSKTPEKALTSGDLKGLYALSWATLLLRSAEPTDAIPYVEEAIRHSSSVQKSRLNFLLGQLLALKGDKEGAYRAFGKASSSSAPYVTRFNARIKQSEVYSGSNPEPEVKALLRMTRYDRNKEYLDQIYYAIGNLYLSRGDTLKAIDNYKLAAEKSTRNGIDKAISQVTLGALYFDRGEYDLAQPCYSEAVPLLPESYPGYEELRLRSDVLDELALYSQNVNLNDSLLRLAAMTEPERIEVFKKIIADLKKREKEEEERAKREEYLASQQGNTPTNTGNAANAPATFTMNNDNSWYFYNKSTVAAGKTEFQRRWGSRKLEDDWRRRNKQTFSFDDFAENNDEEADTISGGDDGTEQTLTAEELAAKKAEDDPHELAYYLKQVPVTPEQQATCNDIIQEGMYNIGLILKDRLEDFPAAAHEWEWLLDRYPGNPYTMDVYYNMYLMYMREGRSDLAARWRAALMKDFPESAYGKAVADPNYIDNLRRMDAEQEQLYAAAYEAYLDNRNTEVHAALADMERRYPLSKLMPRFMFIDALAYVTENNQEAFRKALSAMLERYPDTDMTPLASAYLKGLAQGRKLHSGSSNMRGMLWDMHLGSDSIEVSTDSIDFDLNPDEPQLLVLVYPTDEVNGNRLLFDMARHNFGSFVVKDFDLEPMNFGRLGLLLVKGFENFDELVHYRRVLAESEHIDLPPQVRPVMISVKNFDALLHGGRTFEDYFRYVDEKAADARLLIGPAPVLEEEIVNIDEPELPDSIPAPEPPAPSDVPVPSDTPDISPSATPAPQTPRPAQKPAPAQPLPEYPAGSEDDDLLD